MQKITGVIITLNEANNIEDCIASLRLVCDEIIIVDSTDVCIQMMELTANLVVYMILLRGLASISRKLPLEFNRKIAAQTIKCFNNLLNSDVSHRVIVF